MTESLSHWPERWLLCPALVAAEVRATCIQPASAEGLAQVRDRAGLIEDIELADLPARVAVLHAEGWPVINIVLPEIGPREQEALTALGHDAEGVFFQSWRDERSEVAQALNAPDTAIAQSWAKHECIPWLSLRGPRMDQQVWLSLLFALLAWEKSARALYGEDFVELYGKPSQPEHVHRAPAAASREAMAAPAGADDVPPMEQWLSEASPAVKFFLPRDPAGELAASITLPETYPGLRSITHVDMVFSNGLGLRLGRPDAPLNWQPAFGAPGYLSASAKAPMAEYLRCTAGTESVKPEHALLFMRRGP